MGKDWKANQGNWTFIQSLSDSGTLCCLTEQERSTLQTFLRPAYWQTRWTDTPEKDELKAFCAEIEHKLMEDCTLSLIQIGCTINLVLNGQIISSMPFDAEECDLLGGADGEGSGDYDLEAQAEELEDKKTELFSGAMALVKYCSEAVSDFFDAIDAEIELGLAATVWMETVPGLDLSPANEVLQAADALNDMLRALFLAADTPDWREQESCKIMCWCVTNDYTFDASICDKWREDLLGYGVSFPQQGYWQVVNVLTNRALMNRFALGMNDDDEDWIVLCDSCLLLIVWIDFDDDDAYTFVKYGGHEGYELAIVDAAFGNPLQSGVSNGWGESPAEYVNAQVCIRVDFETTQTIVQVGVDYYYTGDVQGEASQTVVLYDDEDNVLDSEYSAENEVRGKWHHTDLEFSPPVEDVSYAVISYGADHTENEHVILHMDNVKIYTHDT